MWHDNDTDTDLLGFDQLVDAGVELVKTEALLPLTIGVFGDWGSGKSSLMKMMHQRLAAEPGYVCVTFSPWQHEDYTDVKASLMVAVMTALRDRRSLWDKLEDIGSEQARGLWEKLRDRINWFRAAGFLAKGVSAVAVSTGGDLSAVPLAIGSLGDLAQTLKAEDVGKVVERVEEASRQVLAGGANPGPEPVEQGINEFRADFAALLDELDIQALVVFIDDLDRCLPPNIVDTFEAIRLFLAVPKTAFVIGADERIVRHAIATRYPELPDQAVNIGRDYLEKIVQIPLRIPPLTPPEMETYLNLLGCQVYLPTETDYDALVAVAQQNRRAQVTPLLDVAMNYGIAQTHLAAVPAPLQEYMGLINRIAPTLCGGLEGNPRQTKRFMNTLLLRQRLATARAIDLEASVLAKLMLLEYFHEPFFREMLQWHANPGGTEARLEQLEPEVAGTRGEDAPALSPTLRTWISDERVRQWLLLEPPLANVDLAPYFHFSRDRVLASTSPARRLSQPLQELLGKLLGGSEAIRQLGLKEANTLGLEEFRPLYDHLLERFVRDPRMLDSKLGPLVVGIAEQRRQLVPALAKALASAPTTNIQSALPMQIVSTFGGVEGLPSDLRPVVEVWANQSEAPPLAGSAKRALQPPRKKS
jgi:hypothetical protein